MTSATPIFALRTGFVYQKPSFSRRDNFVTPPDVTPLKPLTQAQKKNEQEVQTNQAILKWPGGKARELEKILEQLPASYENFYDPFVGGGSCYLNITAQKYFINDKCEELMGLFEILKTAPEAFISKLKEFDDIWQQAAGFVAANKDSIISLYNERKGEELVALICTLKLFDESFSRELEKRVADKFKRISKINLQNLSTTEDVLLNTESAIKSAIYNYIRNQVNDVQLPKLQFLAYYYIIRNLAYSGMFRYNSDGKFNVPYGGIGYNSKVFSSKADYFLSEPVQSKLQASEFSSLDFEEFFAANEPTENDFIFLDPPYDTEFSTYSKNKFAREDHKRLADYLSRTKAKWLLVIKQTDFINELYEGKGYNISTFDKKYVVNFKNRNNRESQHLLIRNY